MGYLKSPVFVLVGVMIRSLPVGTMCGADPFSPVFFPGIEFQIALAVDDSGFSGKKFYEGRGLFKCLYCVCG